MDNSKFRKQAEELVEKMTLEEAASQLLHQSPAIERLGIPEYNWWSEALHGVARAGIATVFPQAIGMAAGFDPDFLKEEAEIISTEARAKYNAACKYGDRDIYKGLTYWSPNVNIFRDPRWGRGHETYGEDPYLTSRLGVAFIEGLQGDIDNEKYMKIAACAKHFAVHSGPEALRHEFDARATEKDLFETYLPAFESAVKEARVESVMGAYNRTNGEPCCANERLLVKILRGEWGFDGHVVSDCWAVRDFHEHHNFTSSPAESASIAVKRGCDLNCGCTFEALMNGYEEGLISEQEIRNAAIHVFTSRFKLGEFADDCEYNNIPYSVVACKEHREMALKAAEKSMVLLMNKGILPLNKDKIRNIAVIGPNAYSNKALYGNYNGFSADWVTDLDGIRDYVKDEVRIYYSQGSDIVEEKEDPLAREGKYYSEAKICAEMSDAVILCVGLDGDLEGEEGDTGNAFASGDKRDLLLPKSQRRLIDEVLSIGKPTIIVIHSGSALDLSQYEDRTEAIIQAWYSGERGGEALARILFGEQSPSGKLPITFYHNSDK
nr:glycoside hydrolase family 3 C-terminal domain-containing protein [Lachnospiraceae bacterium]